MPRLKLPLRGVNRVTPQEIHQVLHMHPAQLDRALRTTRPQHPPAMLVEVGHPIAIVPTRQRIQLCAPIIQLNDWGRN
ncbi:Uncharacterised protein [Mycobacteroides abscessus subsp. abscessus]|nr:Uncharacterised protein [Mycobacteroides abscessus subsp. abscessus]